MPMHDNNDYRSYLQLTKAHRDQFDVGELVTCVCHGGAVGILLAVSRVEDQLYPSTDISRVLWLTRGKRANVVVGNTYYHTVSKLQRIAKYIEEPK